MRQEKQKARVTEVNKGKEMKGFCFYNFSELTGKGRFYIVIALVFAGLYFLLGNAGANAILLSCKVGIFELFPFLTTNNLSIFLLVIGWFLLVCDMPYQREGYKYYMVRSDRYTWLFGQVIYLFLAASTYLFSVFVAVNVVVLPNISVSNDWSLLLQKAVYNGAYLSDSTFHVQSNIMETFSPLEASLRAFFLMTLMLTVTGTIILLCNLYTKRFVGYLIVALLLSLDVMSDTVIWNKTVLLIIQRICPVSLGRNLKLESAYNTGNPGFVYCVIVLLLFWAFSYFIMKRFIKKVDFK